MGFGRMLLKAMDRAMGYEPPQNRQQHGRSAYVSDMAPTNEWGRLMYGIWQRDAFADPSFERWVKYVGTQRAIERWLPVWNRDAQCRRPFPDYVRACEGLWARGVDFAMPLWQQDPYADVDFPTYAQRLDQVGADRATRSLSKWRNANPQRLSLPTFVRRHG